MTGKQVTVWVGFRHAAAIACRHRWCAGDGRPLGNFGRRTKRNRGPDRDLGLSCQASAAAVKRLTPTSQPSQRRWPDRVNARATRVADANTRNRHETESLKRLAAVADR